MNNTPGVILAFDFGLKRIGTAIGNELSRTARPLEIINAEANDIRFSKIGKLIEEWQPVNSWWDCPPILMEPNMK